MKNGLATIALLAIACGREAQPAVVVAQAPATPPRQVDFCDYGRLPMGGVFVEFRPVTDGCPDIEESYYGIDADVRVRMGHATDDASFETWMSDGHCYGVVNQDLGGGVTIRDAFTFSLPRVWSRVIRTPDVECQYAGTVTAAGRWR